MSEPEYDERYARAHEKTNAEDDWEFRILRRLFSPAAGSRVLDVGCNTGEWCALLTEKYAAQTTGIDLSGDAIRMAKEKFPRLAFRQANLSDVCGEEYDVIYLLHVIEHLRDPVGALRHLGGLMAPRGKLVVVCPNHWAFLLRLGSWVLGRRFAYDATHVAEFNPFSLRKTVEQAGFRFLRWETRPLGIPFLQRFSGDLYYSIPSAYFGGHIFLLAERWLE